MRTAHRFVFPLSGFLLLVMTLASCGGGPSGSGSPPPPVAPTVSAFQPTSGPVGTSVIVTGANLTGASAVSFNGMSATFAVNGATQITATVPSGATTGKVSVTTSAGSASSASNFTVTATASSPTITNFNPSGGPVGTLWVVAHSDRRKFELEDVRIMGSLAAFAAGAIRLRQVVMERERIAAASKIIAELAHHINNPLQGAMFALFNLDRDRDLSASAREMVSVLQIELGRVAALSGELLKS